MSFKKPSAAPTATSVSISSDSEEKLKDWSAKTGRPYEEIKKQFIESLLIIKQNLPKLAPAQQEARARAVIKRPIKGALLSPAVFFEGYFFCCTDPSDAYAAQKAKALRAWQENPQQAQTDKLTNVKGEPLDINPKSRRYGKPLPILLRKSAIGICRSEKAPDLKLSIFTLMDVSANIEVPLERSVKFRAILKQDTPVKYVLGGSRTTSFVPTEIKELAGMSTIDILENAPEQVKCPINAITDWHEKNKGDENRVLITEGDATAVSREPTETGSFIMGIEDESLDIETPSVATFLTPEQVEKLDFGPGSRIFVIGRTTPFAQTIGLTAYGFVARPEFKLDKSLFAEQSEGDVEVGGGG